jgi:curli biogenesis system outer membrane secretion channel CsgG
MKGVLAPALLLMLSAGTGMAQQKRSVSVDDFDFSTVRDVASSIFRTNVDIGKGINALLVKRIAQSGKFTVVERAKIDTVLKEQDFGASGRVKRGTGARVGQIRGADFTIMGDIVTFGRDDRTRRGAVGVVVPGAGGAAGGRASDFKAVVTLDFRMVDNESSEIVMTGEARGESKRSSKGGFAGLFVGGVGVGGAVDFTSSNFAETIIGEAVMDAVNKLAAQVETQSGSVGARNIDIEGLVANVEGTRVYLNVGSSSGVQSGDVFSVQRIIKEVRDPATKEVLDTVTEPVCTMTVTTVRERIAIGDCPGGVPKVGDKAVKK